MNIKNNHKSYHIQKGTIIELKGALMGCDGKYICLNDINKTSKVDQRFDFYHFDSNSKRIIYLSWFIKNEQLWDILV